MTVTLIVVLLILLRASVSYRSVTYQSATKSFVSNEQQCLLLRAVDSESISFQGLSRYVELKRRPKAVGIPRRRMDELSFSVNLMRSSYDGIDLLDCTPMDEFQKTFFLFRQLEWETYRSDHMNVMQGDLSDPLYFDFISFAQYCVIADKMKHGMTEFIEKNGAEGISSIVKRNPLVQDNDMLPTLHSKYVGRKILDWMYDRFPSRLLPANTTALVDTYAGIVPVLTADMADTFLSYVNKVMDVFLLNAYAIDINANLYHSNKNVAEDSFLLQLKLRAPINLWGLQVLIQRQDIPVNNFEVKVIQALADANNIVATLQSTEFINSIDVVHTLKLKPRKNKEIIDKIVI